MQWISTLASILHVTNIDIYFIAYALVMMGIFIAIGVNRLYDCFFWLVAGIAIFIVLQVLFFWYTWDLSSGAIMDPGMAKFIVGSSIYLIFVLSILAPVNGVVQLEGGSKNRIINILQTIFLSLFLTIFYTAIIIWLAEKAYIFRLDSALSLLKRLDFWWQMSNTSMIYGMLYKNITWIIVAGVGFVIYKLVLGDIVMTVLGALMKAITSGKREGK